MRILHVLDHSIPLRSGYAFRTLAILKEQRALGWETFHLTSPKQGPTAATEETVDGWDFHRTVAPGGLLEGVPGLGEMEVMGEIRYRIEQLVKRVRPHILHVHSPILNAIPALRVGRRLDLPVVYEVRALWEDEAAESGVAVDGRLRHHLRRALETSVLKRADAITTICEGLRGDIVGRGIASEKVTVIPNAVDIEQFAAGVPQDSELKRKLGLNGELVLGFIGQFLEYEGLAVLLRALPHLLAHNTGARVLLVGGGGQEAQLKKLARELRLADRVIFAGCVADADVQRYYSVMDVVVYPRLSTRLTELVTPVKPLEVMAQRRFIAASDIGGHRELIRDGDTGILFRAGDSADLAVKVLQIVAHPEHMERLKANARRYVERERSWKASVARYQGIYDIASGRHAQ